jgi:hypothetical protein
VVQLHRQVDLIRNAGAELIVIGNGSPSFIAGFREETGWDGPLYTDPSLAVFKAAEMKRGVMRTFNPLALGKTIKAFADGQRQGRTQGDPWQQGGVLVIAPGGDVLLHQASDHVGDKIYADEIVRALAA